ncbi:MAG TPA: cupin domain-containing protein [Candidatus Acidoferrales bacterium]|nr:cupin domain-containing protein [Candidatus Acidoferrales bacterium]
MTELVLKQFEKPDEIKEFEKGKFELVSFAGASLGRATYQPGWRWSEHAGKAAGLALCPVEHLGIVLSGRAMVAMSDGTTVEMRAGDVFHIGPGHDSWVVGDEPYVSLHFQGAEAYSRHWQRR